MPAPINAIPNPDVNRPEHGAARTPISVCSTGAETFTKPEIKEFAQSARQVYGFNPVAFVLPKSDKNAVRKAIPTALEALGPDRWTRALTARIALYVARPENATLIREAREIGSHFGMLKRGLDLRRISPERAALPMLFPWHVVIIGLAFMGLISGDVHVRTGMLALSGAGTLAATVVLAVRAGWRYGYEQALWHSAEVGVFLSRKTAEAGKAASDALRARSKRQMAFELPTQPTGEGYLYVVGFSTDTVKVGQTEDPRRRLGTHRAEAAAFGVHITDYWISPSHINFRANETRLINACQRVSRRSRNEYFHEVGYDRAVQFASTLTCYSDNLAQTSVEGVWA